MHNAPFNRRTFAAVTAMTAASLVAPALWAQPALEKVKISIAVCGKATLNCLPLTIAEQLGYFKAEGLVVEVTEFASDYSASQSVLSGAADVVAGAFENIILQQHPGQPFQAFVLMGRAPAICMGIALKTLPNYKSVADLRGKKIGIPSPGSPSSTLARLVLSRAGLKAEDVSFVPVGSSTAALSAWRSGQIDAMSNLDPVMTSLEHKGDMRIIADTRTLSGTLEVCEGEMPAACLFAPLAFSQKNPNTVQALTDAITRSLKWLQTAGPSDIIKTVPEHDMLGDRALYLSAFNKVREAISPDGVMPDEGPHNVVRMLSSVDLKVSAAKIKIASTYTNQFSKKAKARFQA